MNQPNIFIQEYLHEIGQPKLSKSATKWLEVLPHAMLEEITPLILTYNEEANLERTLAQLRWASRIVIVDSFSTDRTTEIARALPQVEVFQRQFDSFASQCNFGLTKVFSEWVLSLDADYVVTKQLLEKFSKLDPEKDIHGYEVRFKYCVHGYPLRGTLYPPRIVLYRVRDAHYQDEGHGHRVHIPGKTRQLRSFIHHDDRKPLRRWLLAQNQYMVREANHLVETPRHLLNKADRVRTLVLVAPFAVFSYTLFINGVLLDGWRGWYYALQRLLAESLLSLRLIEHRYLKITQSKND